MSDGRREEHVGTRRVRLDRRVKIKTEAAKMIDSLRMQARTYAAAHRRMKVEPSEPELMVEWKAADLIDRLTKNL